MNLKAQVLVLVLIVIGITAGVTALMTSNVIKETEEVAMEKGSTRAGDFAEAGLDYVTKIILSNEYESVTATNFLFGDTEGGVVGMQICYPNTAEYRSKPIEKKCDSKSKVIVIPKYKILNFRIKNSEVLDVYMAGMGKNAAASSSGVKLTTTGQGASDIYLITMYRYDSNIGLTLKGSCLWRINNSVTTVEPSQFKCYSNGTVLNFSSTDVVNMYRIRAVFKSNDTEAIINVTNSLGGDLPYVQNYFLRAGVYTNEGNQEVFREKNRIIDARNSSLPIFDWVLYNGDSKEVVK